MKRKTSGKLNIKYCVWKREVSGSSIANEVISSISSLLIIFLRKDFERTKTRHKQKPTNKTKLSEQKTTKATIFRAHKNF